METAQRSNGFLCCINPENRIKWRVYSLGVVHQIIFIILISGCAVIIRTDVDPDPTFFIVLLIFAIVGFLLTVLSIIGTALKNKYLIFPWLVFGIILVIVEFVNLGYVFKKDGNAEDITENFCLIGVSVSFWVCNLYMYLKITTTQGVYVLIDQQNEENPIVSNPNTSNYQSIA